MDGPGALPQALLARPWARLWRTGQFPGIRGVRQATGVWIGSQAHNGLFRSVGALVLRRPQNLAERRLALGHLLKAGHSQGREIACPQS